jgi:hypothetical protein
VPAWIPLDPASKASGHSAFRELELSEASGLCEVDAISEWFDVVVDSHDVPGRRASTAVEAAWTEVDAKAGWA